MCTVILRGFHDDDVPHGNCDFLGGNAKNILWMVQKSCQPVDVVDIPLCFIHPRWCGIPSTVAKAGKCMNTSFLLKNIINTVDVQAFALLVDSGAVVFGGFPSCWKLNR